MPAIAAPAAPTCHWDYVQGPARNGEPVRTMMWICEYPYRTMRAEGPCDADCPGHVESAKAETADRAKLIAGFLDSFAPAPRAVKKTSGGLKPAGYVLTTR